MKWILIVIPAAYSLVFKVDSIEFLLNESGNQKGGQKVDIDMGKIIAQYCLILLTPFFLVSCSEETLESEYTDDLCGEATLQFAINFTPYVGNSTTTVSNVSTLSPAISFENSRLISTDIPAPSSPTGGTLTMPTSVIITDNSSSYIHITPSGLPSGYHISAVLVQFQGTSQHFLIPIDPDAAVRAAAVALIKAQQNLISDAEATAAQAFADAGGVTINLSGPSGSTSGTPLIQGTTPGEVVFTSTLNVTTFLVQDNAAEPDYSLDTWDGIGDATRWTSTATMASSAVFVGTGVFQASLTWSTGITTGSAADPTAVDLDLYVTEPDDTVIFYGEPLSASTGQLDTDNLLGFGPENIVYTADPVDGTYLVEVVYFDNGVSNLTPTTWTVSVTACNSSQSYTGYLTVKSAPRTVVQFPIASDCTLPDPRDLEPQVIIDLPPNPNMWEQSKLCADSATE